MNLYLVERTDRVWYDEYDSFVIAAETEEDVSAHVNWDADPTEPPKLRIIGVAIAGTEPGVVLGSFNAG